MIRHRASVNVVDAVEETSRGVAWSCHHLEERVPPPARGLFLAFLFYIYFEMLFYVDFDCVKTEVA